MDPPPRPLQPRNDNERSPSPPTSSLWPPTSSILLRTASLPAWNPHRASSPPSCHLPSSSSPPSPTFHKQPPSRTLSPLRRLTPCSLLCTTSTWRRTPSGTGFLPRNVQIRRRNAHTSVMSKTTWRGGKMSSPASPARTLPDRSSQPSPSRRPRSSCSLTTRRLGRRYVNVHVTTLMHRPC
jgi:hypothetical protein